MVSSLEALTLRHASEAARKTAERWSERADAASLIERDPTLWSASPELARAVSETLRDWMHSVIDDVRAASGRKHAVARVAAIGAARTLGLDTAAAASVRDTARARARFPSDTYVLALVGGTGVGKSTLLNALAGDQVSPASARRPTTSDPVAWVPADKSGQLADLM